MLLTFSSWFVSAERMVSIALPDCTCLYVKRSMRHPRMVAVLYLSQSLIKPVMVTCLLFSDIMPSYSIASRCFGNAISKRHLRFGWKRYSSSGLRLCAFSWSKRVLNISKCF